MDIVARVREIAQPLARAEGVDLLDVAFVREGPRRVLRLTVEREGGPTSLADCEAVSRAVDRALEGLDFVPGPFDLEVSSAGLTRPLHTLPDFQRSLGRLVAVTLRQGLKPGSLVGTLEAAGEAGLSLRLADGSARVVPLGDVAAARREIAFGRGGNGR